VNEKDIVASEQANSADLARDKVARRGCELRRLRSPREVVEKLW
jgi:hypothetical protein